MKKQNFLGIDYGDRRVGLATADSQVKIAIPHGVFYNDQQLFENLLKMIEFEKIDTVVIGYPRNQSGEPTAQTAKVENFANKLRQFFDKLVFWDESVTSILAEDRLKTYKKPYSKEDIDAQAAVIILEDYLESNA